MNKNIFLFKLVFLPLLVTGQVILIDKTDSNYIITEKILSASKDTVCYIFNCTNKSEELFMETGGITPFIFFKAYGVSKKNILSNKLAKFKTLEEYVSETVVPKLNADLYLRVNDLGTASRGPDNRSHYDSLVIFDGKTYQLITAIVEINFYNLLDFEQIHPQQATSTIINTKAKIVPYKMVGGFPQVQVKEIDDYPKLYLIKKIGKDYTFSAYSQHSEDDPLAFYREFVYRMGYGVISFKSKWLYRYPIDGIKGAHLGLYSSDKYYYFK